MELTKIVDNTQELTPYEGVVARYNSKDDFTLYHESDDKIITFDSLAKVRLTSNFSDGNIISGNYFLPRLTISIIDNGDSLTKEISHYDFLNMTSVDVTRNGELIYRLMDCSDKLDVLNNTDDLSNNFNFLMNQYKQEFADETKRLNVIYHQEKSKSM